MPGFIWTKSLEKFMIFLFQFRKIEFFKFFYCRICSFPCSQFTFTIPLPFPLDKVLVLVPNQLIITFICFSIVPYIYMFFQLCLSPLFSHCILSKLSQSTRKTWTSSKVYHEHRKSSKSSMQISASQKVLRQPLKGASESSMLPLQLILKTRSQRKQWPKEQQMEL